MTGHSQYFSSGMTTRLPILLPTERNYLEGPFSNNNEFSQCQHTAEESDAQIPHSTVGSVTDVPPPRGKRPRITYKPDHLRMLESEFTAHHYVSSARCKELSQLVGISESQVKTWFQNRRSKMRKLRKKLPVPEAPRCGSVSSTDDGSVDHPRTPTKEVADRGFCGDKSNSLPWWDNTIQHHWPPAPWGRLWDDCVQPVQYQTPSWSETNPTTPPGEFLPPLYSPCPPCAPPQTPELNPSSYSMWPLHHDPITSMAPMVSMAHLAPSEHPTYWQSMAGPWHTTPYHGQDRSDPNSVQSDESFEFRTSENGALLPLSDGGCDVKVTASG